jgi:SAM-dependent methyltransferase
MSHHWERLYTYSDYLTPGAADTVGVISDVVQPGPATVLVDIASGKGTAACSLAARHGCRVIGIDRYDPFLRQAVARAEQEGVRGRAAFAHANGTRLPLADASVDGGYCIGGPSIVGLDACMAEFARVVKPGGAVVVSDIAWRHLPVAPLGAEWGHIASLERITLTGYGDRIAAAGLTLERARIHPREAWDSYFAPMAQAAAAARAAGDAAFAGETEASIALEGRAADVFLDYVTFVARRE